MNAVAHREATASLEELKAVPMKARVDALQAAYRTEAGTNDVRRQSPLPSTIRQQLINRLDQRLTASLWALNFGIRLPGEWGTTLTYATVDDFMPAVHKLGAPGGNFQQLLPDPRDEAVLLGKPIVYSTDEILIPRWDWNYPDRYIEELERVADRAAYAISRQVDSDARTALAAQLMSSGMKAAAWNWMDSQAYGIPDSNDMDQSAEGAVNLNIYMDIAEYADLIERELDSFYMHPSTIKTMWQQVTAPEGTGDGYFPVFPEVYRAELLGVGERMYNQFFGRRFPLPTPTNSIDVTGDDKYFWALLSPRASNVPQGAFWLWDYPGVHELEENGQAYTVDNLIYVRSMRGNDARIYDVYVAQKAYLLAYCDLQIPNLLRVQYDAA